MNDNVHYIFKGILDSISGQTKKEVPENELLVSAKEAFDKMPIKIRLEDAEFIFTQGFIKGAYHVGNTVREVLPEETPTLFLQED